MDSSSKEYPQGHIQVMENDVDTQPQMPNGHRTDALATKFVDRTGDLQGKAQQTKAKPSNSNKDEKQEKQPAGGHDETPVPSASPGYTLKFTFHRATNLPMADINSLSSDPFIVAQLHTSLPVRHKEDPPMRLRTPTIRRSTEPVWNCEWIVANVPASGFALKARLYDEDPADHDDRLGNVHVHVNGITGNWEGIHEQGFKIKKRMGSTRAYLIQGCAAMFSRGTHMAGELFVSVKLLERTESNNEGRTWTVGPCAWSKHLSPLIGRLAGTKEPGKKNKDGEKETERYNFQANQFQLAGPVPPELYHRYVEFKPFVAGMFTAHSLRGRILNRTLHHQFSKVYNYDRSTVYGSFPSPSKEMSLKFLELVHFDHGGRMYTYVVTLDGQWRFTETGKEFGIDLLSKHTMHSNVNIYIAFSGEFFVRRLKHPDKPPDDEHQKTHPPDQISNEPSEDEPPRDPACYELVIDNDSGTYRPKGALLPQLKEFMEKNLPGLKILALDCNGDKERMDKMKSQQRERKKAEGDGVAFVQGDDSSISSSDEEDLDAQIAAAQRRNQTQDQGQASGDASGNQKGMVGRGLHDLTEPKDRFMQWVEGGGTKDRGKREEENDVAAMRGREKREGDLGMDGSAEGGNTNTNGLEQGSRPEHPNTEKAEFTTGPA